MQLYQNFLIVLRFVGTNYHGWQIQNNAISIQEIFQNALFKVIKNKTDIKGCSRTDSGVHANSFCVSAKISINISEKGLMLSINKFLPNDIRVIKCIKVDNDFHARYSCIAKEYIYLIYNDIVLDPFMYGRCLHFWYHLDIDLMNKLMKPLVGKHDFSSFCSLDSRCTKNMVRYVHYFEVSKSNKIVTFKIKADGFLYNMVRIMVGTILKANYKKMSEEDIINILKSKNRKFAGDTVPSCGLYLNKVFYDRFTL